MIAVDRATDATEMSERARVRREFDEAAPRYEAGRMAPWYQEQGRMVLGELGELAGPIVDVGCGTGWFLRRVARANPGIQAVGVDLSPRMVAHAREAAASEGLTGVRFLEGDWEDPDTADRVSASLSAPAAAVTCISAFHYFREPATALARMGRILAPGGRIILVERAVDGSFLTLLWGALHRWVLRDGVRFYHTRDLEGLMVEAGLVEPRTIRRVRRYLWKGKLYTSLGVVVGSRGEEGGEDLSRTGDPLEELESTHTQGREIDGP